MRKIIILAILLIANAYFLEAQICGTPGKDGPFTGSGIVNTYYTAGDNNLVQGATSLTLGTLNTGGSTIPFSAGDVALIIQIQGTNLNTNDNTTYGDGTGTASGAIFPTSGAKAGNFEFVKIDAVTGSFLQLATPLQFSYKSSSFTTTEGAYSYQIIRVPQFSSVTLTGTISGLKWSGTTGGVIAFDVAGTLNMNNQTISAKAIGFRGGKGAQDFEDSGSPVISYRNAPQSTGDRRVGTKYLDAWKGEGISGTPYRVWNGTTEIIGGSYPEGSKGAGAAGNAGGSGVSDAAGGGGGNYGAGGRGGDILNTNPNSGFTQNFNAPSNSANYHPDNFGGFGGKSMNGIIILGGGGGGGANHTEKNSHGGNGGGIILITANTVTGMGTVTADGANEVNGNNASPSNKGGGGAGGTIIFNANSSLTGVTLTANGGNSSNTSRSTLSFTHAPGGGGGGGVIYHSGGAVAVANGGNSGICTDNRLQPLNHALGATNGGTGLVQNSIPSSLPILSNSCLPKINVTKTTSTPASNQTVTIGNTSTYSINVINNGTGGATGVKITDVLPTGLSYTGVPIITYGSSTGTNSPQRTSTSNPANGATNLNFGTFYLPNNSQITVTFTVTIGTNTLLGIINNSANVTYLDPTRTTTTQTVTPGQTYANGVGTALGSNYNGSLTTNTGEDLRTCNLSIYNLTGGGTSCNSSNVNPINLSGSQTGVNYQLFRNGVAVGTALAGTGGSLSFGLQNTSGTYTVNGNSTINSCSMTMNGNVIVANSCSPIANNDQATSSLNSPVILNVLTNDSDPDGTINSASVVFSNGQTSITVANQGTFTVNAQGQVTFTPINGFYGTVTPVIYTVKDNQGNTSNNATISIRVLAPPIALGDVANNTGQSLQIPILNNDYDQDGGTLITATIDLNPNVFGIQTSFTDVGRGTFTVNSSTGVITFIPVNGYTGTASANYTVNDNHGLTSNSVTITINSTSTAPTAINDSVIAIINTQTSINILNNDYDSDGQLVLNTVDLNPNISGLQTSFTVINQGTFLVNSLGQVVFIPEGGFRGTVQANYTVNDNDGLISNIASIFVKIASGFPIANDDEVTTQINTPITILCAFNDFDIDTNGWVLPCSIDLNPNLLGQQTTVVRPGEGTFRLVNCVVVFTPFNNFRGRSTITYVINDNDGNPSNPATITVTILGSEFGYISGKVYIDQNSNCSNSNENPVVLKN